MLMGMFECCERRSQPEIKAHPYQERSQTGGAPVEKKEQKYGVGIVFQVEGDNQLVVRGFVPNAAAAHSELIEEGDVLLKVDGVDISKLTSSDIARLMYGSAGTTVSLVFARFSSSEPSGLTSEDDVLGDATNSAGIPKLWMKGNTPRNDGGVLQAKTFQYEVTLLRGPVAAK